MATSPKEYLDRANAADVSLSELRELARKEWQFVKTAVARNRKAGPDLLRSLFPTKLNFSHEELVSVLASRNDAPPDSLRMLADQVVLKLQTGRPKTMVGAAIQLCVNHTVPFPAVERILRSVAAGRWFKLQVAAATHRRDVLSLLLADISGAVSARAKKRLNDLAPCVEGRLVE